MKIWLDDERPAPTGWLHVKTVAEAFKVLLDADEFKESIEEISCDNDLGEDIPEGYTFLDKIEELFHTGDPYSLIKTKFRVHSANSGRRVYMEQTIASIKRKQDEYEGKFGNRL